MGVLFRLSTVQDNAGVDAEFQISDEKGALLFCVFGTIKGEKAQIDFNALYKEDIESFINYLRDVVEIIEENEVKPKQGN